MRKRIVWGSALGVAFALVAITAMTALAAVPAQNLGKAIDAQKKLTADHPQDPAVWNDLGNLLLLAHNQDEAETAYRKAVELDGTKASALFNLGLLLQAKGQLKDAQKLFAQVSTLDPKNAWAHYQTGAIYEAWGKKSPAIKEYAQAFALDPQLAFPEVNPHIVENRLVTESMLRAYRGDYGGPQVPTVYDDPSRIASILVPAPQKPADAKDEQANANVQQQPKGPATVLRRGDLDTGSTVGQATPQGGVPSATPPTRTFGRPTVGGAAPGVGVPGMAGRTPTRSFNRPDPSGRAFVPGEGAQPGPVVAPPPTGIYYRPGLP
ncbi:MAG TPA: tetratricopeptide repeat protein, partial [Thermoanaerobaculia bacterium]